MLVCLYGEMRDALSPERGFQVPRPAPHLVWLSCLLRVATMRVLQNLANPLRVSTSGSRSAV